MDNTKRHAHLERTRAQADAALLAAVHAAARSSGLIDDDGVPVARTTYPRLARTLGWSRSTVIRIVRRLREAGSLSTWVVHDDDGRKVATCYRVNVSESVPTPARPAAITHRPQVGAPGSRTG